MRGGAGMNYGLYMAAAGALTSMHRQDVLTNNLANLNTVGFKPLMAVARQRETARAEDGLGNLPSNDLLERLGAGPLLAPTRVSMAQGRLETTNNPLDLAIEGKGFFVIRDQADGSTQRMRLTRDGRFALDSRGRLVMRTQGLPVLDRSNRPIFLAPGQSPTISTDGVIRQGGTEVARIQVVAVPDPTRLERLGESLFAASSEQLESGSPARGTIHQGSVEGSAVNEISALMKISGASGAVQANIGMIRYHDQMMDRAINVLGRVT